MQSVSVIIPIHNEEIHLSRCINSVVNQTYKYLDILLIDDGSTDGSYSICKSWAEKDSRIRVIHKENEGLGISRNKGIALSKSEVITFVDADDWMEECFIEALLAKMEQTGAALSLCNICYWDSQTYEREFSRIRFEKDVLDSRKNPAVMNRVRIFAWGKLWKKSLFTEDMAFPVWTFEDIASIPLLAYKAEKICYVDKYLFNYWRNQADSLSVRGENIPDVQKSLHLLQKRAESLNVPEAVQLEVKKIMLAQVRAAYRRWYMEERYKESLRELSDSLAGYYPCFINYPDITFAKNKSVQINNAIDCVAYSNQQIIEGGNLRFDFSGFDNPESEEEKWQMAEYIMEQM